MHQNLCRRLLSSKVSAEIIVDKCKGCLIGALVGDCYAKPYRYSEEISKSLLQNYFNKLDGPYFKAPFKPYSANVALSTCIGELLLNEPKLEAKDVAKRFMKIVHNEPLRDFGSNILKVCLQLRATKCATPFKAASEQHNGAGSFGNSPAARIPPIVVYHINNANEMVDSVILTTKITHSHPMACYGALIQAWAIRMNLHMDDFEFDTHTYLNHLIGKVEKFTSDELDRIDAFKFIKQLAIVEELLKKGDIHEEEVVNLLGHGKVALFSVPTAIYCFLRAMKPIPDINTSNQFLRTIQYAISLGGDTVSIGGMAGALAGALYGASSIGSSLAKHCENSIGISDYAERLVRRHHKHIERFSMIHH